MAKAKNSMAETLKSFDVWRRRDPQTLVRYRCFEDCSTGRFCVQSADFYRLPVTNERISYLENQFIELLMNQSPFERVQSFASIEEAISSHDESFA
jgi:hypothetical protein